MLPLRVNVHILPGILGYRSAKISVIARSSSAGTSRNNEEYAGHLCCESEDDFLETLSFLNV
jgi:hypothetical protein